MTSPRKQYLTPSEHQEQCAVFDWKNENIKRYPELKYMFGTLNGVRLSIGLAKKAKRAGNVRGVPDIWLPLRLGGANGLVVELKIKGNTTTPEQKDWLNELANNGWMTRVAYGSDEAIKIIEGYLAGKDFQDIDSMHCRRPQDDRHAISSKGTTKDAIPISPYARGHFIACTTCRWKSSDVCKQCPDRKDAI